MVSGGSDEKRGSAEGLCDTLRAKRKRVNLTGRWESVGIRVKAVLLDWDPPPRRLAACLFCGHNLSSA